MRAALRAALCALSRAVADRFLRAARCAKEKDAEDPACVKYASYYRAICPTEWVDKWNEQRENGTWMGKY